MTETWIFARGRWKVISERGLLRLFGLALVAVFVAGFAAGTTTFKIRFDAKIANIHRLISENERELLRVEKILGINPRR